MSLRIAVIYIFRDLIKLEELLHQAPPETVIVAPKPSTFASPIRNGAGQVVRFRS